MKRRQFLESAMFGTGAVVAGQIADSKTVLGQQEKTEALPPKNKPKKPVSTDPVAIVPLTEKVSCSRIGFGCGMRGYNRSSNITRMERSKAVELLQFAYDKGIRMFDTADLYGAHPVVAEAMKGKPRDSYVLLSKIWEHGNGLPEDERPAADIVVKRFLKELKTDYLDVVQIHCMMSGDWTKTFEKQMEILEKLKKEGLIRAHGVSCHANAALELAAKTPWTDVVHVRLNPEKTNMEGTVEEVVGLTKKAHDAGIGTIAMKVIGEGKFKTPESRKQSTRFVSKLDCVDVMIVGFDEMEHITEFIENVKESLAS